MTTFWESVRNRLKEDGLVYLVLVADHSVHSPGTTGARIAVFRNGTTLGTIGGGVMELDALDLARKAFDSPKPPPRIRKLYHRKEGEGEKSGLICAGFQTNLDFWLDRGEHLSILEEVIAAEQVDRAVLLEIGSKGLRVVEPDHKGPSVQYELEDSGSDWRYRELTRNLSRVAIMGGGHCGLALSSLMHRLGYYVSIFDTRPRVPTMLENDFTDEKHIVNDFADSAAMVRVPEHTSVVVMTTELSSDIRALLGVAAFSFPFVGVMGSRAKIVAIRKALAESGVSQDFLDRLVAPVGLPIGSNTPDEIAVSVAAQLLQRRTDSGQRAKNRAPRSA